MIAACQIWLGRGGGSHQTTQFRYIRLELTKLRNIVSILQLSRLDIIDPASWTIYQWPVGTTAFDTPNGRNEGTYASTERPDKLLDGLTSTKMCRQGVPKTADISCYVYIDIGEGNAIDISVYRCWRWWTANDNMARDPVSFNLAFSNDNATWQMMDTQTDYPVTLDRQAVGYYGDILPTAWTNPYVTDGLVAMWDGEWNVKGGVHDSTTTIWKDLAGNYDLDVDLTQAEWSDDFLKVTGTTCTRDTEVDNVLTAEVVYRDAYGSGYPNNEGSYFTFGHARGPCSFWYGHVISGGTNIGDGVTVPSNGFSTNDISPQRTVRHSFSFIYKIGDVAWYRDASSYALYSPPNKSIQSGVRAYCASPSEGIELTCVRLYSRALTAAEIAANYAVDKARFNLP